jgi:glycine hydroxymethyltransferase
MREISDTDPEIARVVQEEVNRQNNGLELIASENFVSAAILEVMGSVLTNKYAEGYPGRRYYGGCENVDVAEELAIERAKNLFQADHANVQPHSGAQANMAVYFAHLKPGDTVLGMNLAHGGHLTHGHPLNFSGQLYEIVPYGVRQEDERIDYEELNRLAHECRPKLIVVGASAYPRLIDFERIRDAANEVGAAMMTDMAHIAGLVAAGIHPSPVPHSDYVTSTTHKTLRGPRGGLVLCRGEHTKNLNRSLFPGVQGGPLMHIIAAKAVCFKEASEPGFSDYQKRVVANAKRLAGALTSSGFRLVSGGTDNHLLLVDVFSKGLTGKVAEEALGRSGITVNKNAIPFDENPPMIASGIRLGTPAVTTRGMGEPEMDKIGELITRVLAAPDDDQITNSVRSEIKDLCEQFPLYPDLS